MTDKRARLGITDKTCESTRARLGVTEKQVQTSSARPRLYVVLGEDHYPVVVEGRISVLF